MSAELPRPAQPVPWWGLPDGNDWVFLPGSSRSRETLQIPELVLLSEAQRGLLRLAGAGDVLIGVRGAGVGITMRRRHRGFTIEGARLHITVNFGGAIRHALTARWIASTPAASWDAWRRILAFEAVGTTPVGAFALAPHGDVSGLVVEGVDHDTASDVRVDTGAPLRVTLEAAGPVHVTVGATADAAIGAAPSLRRSVRESSDSAPVMPAGSSRRTADNLWFCRIASLGRAVDTGEWLPVISRSPRNDMGGMFRARDWFRWALPALAISEPELARVGLLAACRLVRDNIGTHTLDLVGGVVEAGFMLDQAADVALGIHAYVRLAGEEILAEPDVQDALMAVGEVLPQWHDPGAGLFRTELAPAGEEPPGRFLSVPNAMAVAAYQILKDRKIIENTRAVQMLRSVWHETFVRDGWLVGAVGDEGQAFTWDDPVAGILSLPRLGVLEPKLESAWIRTVDELTSSGNTAHADGRYPGQRMPGTAGTSTVALADSLLAWPPGHERSVAARNLAEAAGFDGGSGLACVAFDPDAGTVEAGAAFAGGSGLLARGLLASYGLG
ncbi:MAG: hypothetical protein IT198_01135 [Acidimicrobiia bacterium]|nr:hypothetical protein [Acidimicrobiia bacterium]